MKVTINGEVFGFDPSRQPMEEALAIENALQIPYAQYEAGLREGSVKSVAGFIWLVWRRNGRDVALGDILSGAVDIDLNTLDIVPEEGEEGPTTLPPPASSTTAAATSARSPKSSASSPGRSAS